MNRLHIDSASETNCLHSPMTLNLWGTVHLATRSRSASMSFQLELLTEKYLLALSDIEPRCKTRNQ